MKNVLYVGNALSSKGKNVTPIETLSEHLKEICHINVASNKSNKLLRLIDMVLLVIYNRRKTDIVLIDTYSTQNFYYAVIIGKICKAFQVEYIPILHGGNLENRLKNSPKLCQNLFNNAKCLVSPSKFLKSTFENYGYANVEYIPNCIEICNYLFLERDIDAIKLLWVRSFSELYNPQMAVLVLETLIKKGYKTSLTMVGPDTDGSLVDVKKTVKDKNLDVSFTGKLSKIDWINISKDHNVFINTTNYDNMPVSLIEAMALGLPIVSTNVGGIPFLIRNKVEGVLVMPNDIEAMSNAVLNLRANKIARKKMIHAARLKAESFDWDSVKPAWKRLLE